MRNFLTLILLGLSQFLLAQIVVPLTTKSTKAKHFDNYVLEKVNDETFLYLKEDNGFFRERVQLKLLNSKLEPKFSEVLKKTKFIPSNYLAPIQYGDKLSLFFYHHYQPISGLSLKTKLKEYVINTKKGSIVDKYNYKLDGFANNIKLTRFNNKTYIGGTATHNPGTLINTVRLAIPALFLATAYKAINAESISKSLDRTLSIGLPISLIAGLMTINYERPFMAELKEGLIYYENMNRLWSKPFKNSSVEDFYNQGDSMLYVGLSNNLKKLPPLTIDAFNKKMRLMSSKEVNLEKNTYPKNIDFDETQNDTLVFYSLVMPIKNMKNVMAAQLLFAVKPRTYLHGVLTAEDLSKGDEAFEKKIKKRKERKNNIKQDLLKERAKSIEGKLYIENTIDKKGKKQSTPVVKTKTIKGDVIPPGDNFETNNIFTNERISYDTIDGIPYRYTLRQMYYITALTNNPNKFPQNFVTPTTGSMNAMAPMGSMGSMGGAAGSMPMRGIGISFSRVKYITTTKNLSLRIENMYSKDFSQFLVDKDYFVHVLEDNANKVEKMHATLNTINGEAYVSLIDKKKNLKTYRYNMEGGELVSIIKLGDVTKISFLRKVVRTIFFPFSGMRFGYYDYDVNPLDKDKFIVSSYVKSLRDESGKKLSLFKRKRFITRSFQVMPKAPKQQDLKEQQEAYAEKKDKELAKKKKKKDKKLDSKAGMFLN